MVDISVRIEPTTDPSLHPWSYSRLIDLNTCEMYGTVRSTMRKTFPSTGRALALEAGRAAHDAFAACRLYKVLEDGHGEHFEHHMHRVFGRARGSSLISRVRRSSESMLNCISLAVDALHTSGYYDDPFDKRRTMSNIEEAIYAYVKSGYHRLNPVYIEDETNPASKVGVEIPFDYTLFVDSDDDTETRQIRYIGTIDAIHVSQKTGRPYVEENKTASRLGDPWAASFQVSHQITGYCVFASALLDTRIAEAVVRGVSLPQPRKASTYTEGVRSEYIARTQDQIERFFKWIHGTYMKTVRIGTDVEKAMLETHSCNRYFQACSLIPFCTADGVEERRRMLDEMVAVDLSPSELAAIDKHGE
jgi:hypothetical protein